MSNVYVAGEKGKTEPMEAVHCKDEDKELQTILMNNFNLLAGDQISPEDPRHWMLIKREMPVSIQLLIVGVGDSFKLALIRRVEDCLGIATEVGARHGNDVYAVPDRKSTRLNSSHLGISYAVFCL